MTGKTGSSIHAIVIPAGEPPEWIELLPAEKFVGRDGRGPFTVSDTAAIIRASFASGFDSLPIDYDHATDLAATQGNPAPAAGWIKELQERAGAIWGRVEWTERGANAVRGKEYRFISPVFIFARPADAPAEAQTGTVIKIMRAALTNNPNLELTAVAAQQPRSLHMPQGNGKEPMTLSKLVAALEKALPDATPDMIMRIAAEYFAEMSGEAAGGADAPMPDKAKDNPVMAVARKHRDAAVMRAMPEAAKETAEQITARTERELGEVVAAAKTYKPEPTPKAIEPAKAAAVDPAKFVSVAQFQDVMTELNTLKVERACEKATLKVDDSIREGKLTPAQREWAIAYCAADAAGFEKFIAKQPKLIAHPDGTITSAPPQTGAAPLTPIEKVICAQMGVAEDKYLEHRKAKSAQAAA